MIDNKLENDHLSSGNLLVGENRSGRKLQLKRVSVKGQVVKVTANEFVVFVVYFTRALGLALTVIHVKTCVEILIHNHTLKVFKEVVSILTFY